MTHFKGRDIISIDQFTADEIVYLLDKAAEIKAMRQRGEPVSQLLAGKTLVYAFFEDSTRTMESSIAAAENQGMRTKGFDKVRLKSMSKEKGETDFESLESLADYYNASLIAVRHGLDGSAQFFADNLQAPVVNCGDGRHQHPTQAFVDMFSIRETQGRLDNLKIAVGGDLKYGRTVHSFITALRKYSGNQFILVNPPGLGLPEEYFGDDCIADVPLIDAISICDIFYMTRPQIERMDEDEKKRVMRFIQLKTEMFDGRQKPNMVVLHPRPINSRNPEIPLRFHLEVPRHAYYKQQQNNGVPVRESLFLGAVGAIGDDFCGRGYESKRESLTDILVPIPCEPSAVKIKKDHNLRPVINGTVIDHIPESGAIRLYIGLNLSSWKGPRMATGVPSGTMGTKDIIMIEGRPLDDKELYKVAIYEPGVTINVVQEGKIVGKYKTRLPDVVEGLIPCSNSNCISNDPFEELARRPKFFTERREPAELKCRYCDTKHSEKLGNMNVA